MQQSIQSHSKSSKVFMKESERQIQEVQPLSVDCSPGKWDTFGEANLDMLLSPPVFSTLKIVPPKQIQTIDDDVNISKNLFTSVEQEREIPTNVKEPKVVKRSMRLAKANKVSKKCHTTTVELISRN